MNPNAAHPTSAIAMIRSIWIHRKLTIQLIKREISARYRGSFLGLAWSFLNPLLMLSIYTFVFSIIFKVRWNIEDSDNTTHFAIVLFVGLIIHTLFTEVISRAPSLISSNVNYVKKVIFPLEILPIVTLGMALFHSIISFGVLLCGFLFLSGYFHLTAILLPIIIFPLLLITLGIAWFLTSLGVYLRDIGQFIGLVSSVMLFMSPIFYPISALPEKFHLAIMLNPLTFIIEQSREILLLGHLPNWTGLAIYTLTSVLVAWFGYFWFQKTRRGFSDVL